MHVSVYDCQSARDFFASVREAARDADRISRTIARMESREGVHGQSYSPAVHGGDHDARAATDARMDYERRVHRRREDDYALIDRACAVIYGADQTGHGGVSALMGPAYADVLWWRFCAAETWKAVAAGTGMSVRWCQCAADAALDQIDSYGMGRMLDGKGMADE